MDYIAPMSIRLTPDQEALVAHAIESGHAPNAEAFIDLALRNQRDAMEHQSAFEHWLSTEVVEGHEEYMRDPSTGRSLAETRAELLGD